MGIQRPLFFGVAGSLAALLIVSQLSSFRDARALSERLSRAQGDAFVRELRHLGRPSPEGLDALFEEGAANGLRYVAVSRRGAIVVEKGESRFGDAPLARPGRLQKRDGLVRFTHRLRRRNPQNGPVVVVEFAPTWSTQLIKSARRDLAFSTLVALALLVAAAVFWRASARAGRAERGAREAAHLAALGQMSAVLAHEIKNPLASLKGHAQLLEERLPAASKERDKAHLVVNEAKRVQHLIEDLLAFAQNAELSRAACAPADLVRQALAHVDAEGVIFDESAAPARWPLDAARFEQVIVNLVTNARQWSDKSVRVRLAEHHGDLVLEVRDDGPGLPAGDEARVFEAFFTTRTKGGVGLGLSVARRIIELHGGTLTAKNHEGGGGAIHRAYPQGGWLMARVLVVDDEDGVRSFLAEALELAGHEVSAAVNGREALDAVRANAFQVVVTDLKMPELDGLGLLNAIKREQPELEVIVLTAHGSVDSAVEAMKVGAFDFLQKPLESPAALRLVVERALERRGLKDKAEAGKDRVPTLTWGDPAMIPVVDALRKVAPVSATVLLTGESGVGKEVAARALHTWSKRHDGPFVAVNCAALSETLLESELFGHEKGAFTGADKRRRGKLELAEGGTFFLDEVGELKPELQAKLLRALQERKIERVGGNQTLNIDARFVAATNRDLRAMVAAGSFREDLFHRLNVFPIHIPALRERPADLVPLAELLLSEVGRELGRAQLRLSAAALDEVTRGAWRGNVRELRNTLERAAILAEGEIIDELGAPAAASLLTGAPSLADAEKHAIEAALRLHEGNRKKAATHLGIGERTLYDKLKRYGLK